MADRCAHCGRKIRRNDPRYVDVDFNMSTHEVTFKPLHAECARPYFEALGAKKVDIDRMMAEAPELGKRLLKADV